MSISIDGGAIEVVDVVEVPKQRARRDPRPVGDLPAARGVRALLEQRDQRVDHGLAVLVTAQASPIDFEGGVGGHALTINY